MNSTLLMVPISLGELYDKIVILEIKSANISDPEKLINVRSELKKLRDACPIASENDAELLSLVERLREANKELWDLEDRIREKERDSDFGPEFVEIARLIYRTNDRRASAKKDINLKFGSAIIEEKSYQPY